MSELQQQDIPKLKSERRVPSNTVQENGCSNGDSYDLVFPALPDSKRTEAKTIGTNGQCATPNVSSKGLSKVRATTVNQVFTISSQDRKSDECKQFDENEYKRICSQIIRETGAEIEISTSKNMNLTFLVRGKEVDVFEAKRRIIASLQTQVTSAVSVPKEHHFQVTGKQGKRRKEIEQRTGVRIQMPSIQDTSDIINVTGTRDAVGKAVHEIRMISDELSKKTFERIEIQKVFHPLNTDDHNEKQNALMKETGDKIHAPSPSVKTEKITIARDKGVQSVIETIEQINTNVVKESPAVFVEIPKQKYKHIIARKGKGLPMLYKKSNSLASQTIECPGWMHRFLIGKNGSNLRELIKDNRKVHVEFLDSNKIIVKGPNNTIPTVIDSLKKSIVCYDSTELIVDSKFCKHIIGKNGSNINRVKNDTGVIINISESENNSNIIRIEGRKDGVQLAKCALKEMIYQIENKVEKEISIDQRHHRAIIGVKGEKVRELQEAYNVQITFPNSVETKSNLVKIRGLNNDVNKAFESLAKLAKELDEANYVLEISLVKRFHRLVVGKGGTTIKKIREETDTRIDLPHGSEDSDIIKVIGNKEKVLSACDMIKKIVNEMEIIVTKEIVLGNVKVRNIIVNLGNKFIQSIKEDCGRNITLKLPAVKGDNTIVMKGPENDVDCAITQIQTMINEFHNSVIDLKVKPEFLKYLIGKKRANVKRIRDLTNTRIIFPPGTDSTNCTNEKITIIGKKVNVDKARTEFEIMMVDMEVMLLKNMST